jgi:hypothetical protein
MKSYETSIHGNVSLQTVGGAAPAPTAPDASPPPVSSSAHQPAAAAAATTAASAAADARLGDSALYAFVYPNFMVNRYGPWLDTNWVTPTGPDSCVVVFDYYLEPELAEDAGFIEESLVRRGVWRWEFATP